LAVVMINANSEIASVPITQNRVFLRIDMDFTNRTDKATFYYSLDSTNWKAIGNTLSMKYNLTHFMGYRFGLFNYATKAAGGFADFDWFQIGSSVSQKLDMYSAIASVRPESHYSLSKLGLTISSAVSGARSLAVNYELGREGQVELSLVSPNGMVLDHLVNARQSSGPHVATSNLTQVPVGHYYLVGKVDGTTFVSRSVAVTK